MSELNTAANDVVEIPSDDVVNGSDILSITTTTAAVTTPISKPPNGIQSAPNSGNISTVAMTPNTNNKAAIQQLQKMKEANLKYKNLLKMAKERIEQQEQELKKLRSDAENNKNVNTFNNKKKSFDEDMTSSRASSDIMDDDREDYMLQNNYQIVRVCQCIKFDLEAHETNSRGLNTEIWALLEYESIIDPDTVDTTNLMNGNNQMTTTRIKKWKRFDIETDLSDYIRRDTGEPITIPPYSLTPQQSSRITNEAEKKISQITEEYRRFRVKSEMTRKQMDTQIRELQSTNVESVKRRIEGKGVEKELEAARTEHTQLERIRNEMSKQEAQWKEAYDLLLKENEALKSSGSEALLASQWRQRYETCLKEKEEAINKLKMAEQRSEQRESEGKYEMKYRDLKESFRLYRKKAKEIFEAQNNAATDGSSNGNDTTNASDMMIKLSQRSNEDSKLSYLKNLMVNYFTSDPEVREHMEPAIGTVLQFTPDDIAKIEAKKTEGSWGIF